MEGRAQEDAATSLRLLFTILNSVYVSKYDVNQEKKIFDAKIAWLFLCAITLFQVTLVDVDEDDDDPLCTLIVSLIQVLKAKSRCMLVVGSVLYSLPTSKSQKGRRELRHEGAGMLSIGEMSTKNFFSSIYLQP